MVQKKNATGMPFLLRIVASAETDAIVSTIKSTSGSMAIIIARSSSSFIVSKQFLKHMGRRVRRFFTSEFFIRTVRSAGNKMETFRPLFLRLIKHGQIVTT
ncbi:hypothetical protein D915_010896 [Fasciola hepatica]|uniref:Uncharacterized protein n=1 Tax=Fasciola hepatica TaxID=6192 RepID=A0A4E0QXI3_FASHE|nr:hypothetical protein D915_010896 [Fasciola hepatica]